MRTVTMIQGHVSLLTWRETICGWPVQSCEPCQAGRRDKSSNRTLKHHRWPKCLQVACLNDRLGKLDLQSLCPRTASPPHAPQAWRWTSSGGRPAWQAPSPQLCKGGATQTARVRQTSELRSGEVVHVECVISNRKRRQFWDAFTFDCLQVTFYLVFFEARVSL